MTVWSGSWEGGRIATRDGTEIYFIEKSLGPRGARKRLTHSLGPVSIEEARVQLAMFRKDPFAYRTPERAVRDEHARAEKRKLETEASAIILDEALIADFANALRKGYSSDGPVCAGHRRTTLSYLARWATSPVMYGRDLRTVQTVELRKHLEQIDRGVKNWIVSLRSLTAWLRWRGDLKQAEDPSLGIPVPPPRRSSPEERAAKIYDIKLLEKTYARLASQDLRDMFRVRISTGMHLTEVRRIAKGKCVITPVKRSRIAATIDFAHKAGQTHRQSVTAETLAGILRLQDRFKKSRTLPKDATLSDNLKRIADASGQKRIMVANLRHTFITLATERGELVNPPGMNGVPVEVVAQLVGHHDSSTTKAHYLGNRVPPMIVLPINFRHRDDPVVTQTAVRGNTERSARQLKEVGAGRDA